MRQFHTYIAVLCAVLVATPATFGQQNPGVETRGPLGTEPTHWYSGVTEPYQSRVVPPVNVSNSSRVDALLRAGNLYLSLSDAIALALENNLDVEIERYEFSLAEADLLRAQSGAGINGIPTSVLPGIPSGAGLGLLGSTSTGIGSAGASSPLFSGLSYDPFVSANLNFGHTTSPQSNTVTTGTNALVTTNKTANFGFTQTFATGGYVALNYNNIVRSRTPFAPPSILHDLESGPHASRSRCCRDSVWRSTTATSGSRRTI